MHSIARQKLTGSRTLGFRLVPISTILNKVEKGCDARPYPIEIIPRLAAKRMKTDRNCHRQ